MLWSRIYFSTLFSQEDIPMFSTISDVRAANKTSGDFWFDRKTMRFFNSIIESKLYSGRYFITSERFEPSYPKRYSIREATGDGDVKTVGEFQRFHFKEDAQAEIRRLLKAVQS
jgi:hypothetical protein